ncbi:MAG: hypothetical protein AAGC53_09295 [Actinomycetota bacterium]
MRQRLIDTPIGQRGEAITLIYLTAALFDGSPMLSLLRSALTNDVAASMFEEFISSVFLAHADQLIDGPKPQERLALIGAHLMGVVASRELLSLAPLTEASIDELVALIGPAVQTYFDAPTP